MTLLATQQFSHYGPVGVLLLIAVLFAFGNIIASRIIGPRRLGDTKGTTYESGVDPVGTARQRFNVRFYMIAVVFLLFDVEIVFLYPWAITFASLNPDAELGSLWLGRMLFFVLTSIIAFAYAWRKGVFRYE